MNSSEMSTSRSFARPRPAAANPERRARDTRSDDRLSRPRAPAPPPHPRGPRYDRHEVPVRDVDGDAGAATGDSQPDSTISSLDKTAIENVSQEIEAFDELSLQSLESSIKFFKTTVEKIFETFYANLQDLELYKRRFRDILEKRAYSVKEMEDFIKDMLNNIVSSEISLNSDSRRGDGYELKTRETNTTTSMSGEFLENLHSVVEAYKNDNYMTDSTQDENPKRYGPKRETFNLYLLNATPNVHIKVNERSVLSEIIIKDEHSSTECRVASAENIRKITAKKIENEKRETHVDNSSSDREIPVKTSSAKKNIHSSKEFLSSASELSATPEPPGPRNGNKSLISKICDYLCRKLRKSSFM